VWNFGLTNGTPALLLASEIVLERQLLRIYAAPLLGSRLELKATRTAGLFRTVTPARRSACRNTLAAAVWATCRPVFISATIDVSEPWRGA
jgi:hypothetical protein